MGAPPDDDEELREAARTLQALRAPLLRLLLARVEQRRHGATAAERLTPSQHLTLAALENGPLAMGELAAETGVALSSATRMTQSLERAGLVAPAPTTQPDRRRRYVALTALGATVTAEATAVQMRRLEALLAPLTRERRAAILAGAEALTEALLAGSPTDPPASRPAPRRPRS